MIRPLIVIRRVPKIDFMRWHRFGFAFSILLGVVSIALFAFAVLATLRVPESNWLVACIFPVFIACILGFMMSIYAWSEYGTPLGAGSLIVPLAAVVFIQKPLSTRTLFIVICGATVVGLDHSAEMLEQAPQLGRLDDRPNHALGLRKPGAAPVPRERSIE